MRAFAILRGDAVQAGVEQEIAGHGELEIEGRLLKHDAEPRQRRHRVAPHVVAHDGDVAGIRDEQAGQELEQRRLAGAIGAEERDELARECSETDPVDRADRAVALDHLVEAERRRALVRCHGFPG